MNTKEIAEGYRLSHWAGIIQERKESGLSIKAYCERSGFHENSYYYWQRKLREAACGMLSTIQDETGGLTMPRFPELKLTEQNASSPASVARQDQVCIDAEGIRIAAGSEYPVEKLAALVREVMRP
jgi:transposase-like protein